MNEELELLKEIRRAVRFLVSEKSRFANRSVPSEGGPSSEEQDRWSREAVERVMKTGSAW